MSSTAPRKTFSATLVIDKFSEILDISECKDVPIEMEHLSSIRFGIQPSALLYEDSYVFVYWHNEDDAFKFRANVSILNSKGKKLFTKEYYGEFVDENDENHCSLMPCSTLVSAEKGYLHNDKLTLLCEFEVIEDEPKIPDTIRHNFGHLFENLQSLLTDVKYSDFTLIVGKDAKKFPVHKNILAARSPVFAAMFEHDCEEKRENKVNITDMDEEMCGEMLRFVYTGEVKELDRLAMELLVAADKYQLSSLSSICSEYICNHLKVESVANVLILANLYQATELKAKCIEYICANVEQVESTDGWKELDSKPNLLKELVIYFAKKK